MTIVWGVRFSIVQEGRRKPEYLQAMYQELNRRSFDSSLPNARVEWADLTDSDCLGETYQESDDLFVILVDRNTNFMDGELLDTVQHETCHVATWGKEQEVHGPIFQACMARIKRGKS